MMTGRSRSLLLALVIFSGCQMRPDTMKYTMTNVRFDDALNEDYRPSDDQMTEWLTFVVDFWKPAFKGKDVLAPIKSWTFIFSNAPRTDFGNLAETFCSQSGSVISKQLDEDSNPDWHKIRGLVGHEAAHAILCGMGFSPYWILPEGLPSLCGPGTWTVHHDIMCSTDYPHK